MSEAVIVAFLALLGTLVGSFAGILTANKLTNYRIQELEKKVDKHNNFAEKIPIICEQIKVANHRINDLESEVHHYGHEHNFHKVDESGGHPCA